MDIVGKARKLERKIARSLDAAVVELAGASEPAPLEIVHAVLDRAEHQIQEAGRGVRVFPFNRIKVIVRAAPGDTAGPRTVRRRGRRPAVARRAAAGATAVGGCAARDLVVEISYATKAGPQWESPEFNVEFARAAPGAAPVAIDAAAALPRLKLAVVTGKASQRTQIFTGGRIDIGRCPEVLDAKQRVVRTNQVAFDEEGHDANRSVSRRHAHVTFHPGTGEYRLQDDRSARGTSILRAGRTILVPSGSRGVRIESGDEIILGQARLRVTLL
jgi:hypothetical protein